MRLSKASGGGNVDRRLTKEIMAGGFDGKDAERLRDILEGTGKTRRMSSEITSGQDLSRRYS